jgi:hypothetical protein
MYRIAEEASPGLSQVICLTAAIQLLDSTDFTRCGAVTDLSYDTSYGVFSVRVLDICDTQVGMSGGPYYKQNRAYGIHSGHGSGCRAFMYDAQRAENAVNVDILHG